MTILYTDRARTVRVDADDRAELVRSICNRHLFGDNWFDIVHIDLRGDIEACTMFDAASQRQVCSMGGAHAWHVYRDLAEQFDEINFHFRPIVKPSDPPTA